MNGQDLAMTLIEKVTDIPGIKVDRNDFLSNIFAQHVSGEELNRIRELGPIKAGVSRKLITKLRKKMHNQRTFQSSGFSALAGLPGGFAMAATIPADIVQNFAVSIRMAQELGYLYGHEDFWDKEELDGKKISNTLIVFLGVMLGVNAAASATRVLTKMLAAQIAKELPRKPLAKNAIYAILKKVLALIGVNLTKKEAGKAAGKVIPIAGAIIAGGLTFFTMLQMGDRLANALEQGAYMSDEQFEEDLEVMRKETKEEKSSSKNPDIIIPHPDNVQILTHEEVLSVRPS